MVPPISLTSSAGLDIAVILFLGNPDVWWSNPEVGSRSRAKNVQLVCPSYGDVVSMRGFKIWVTRMYDVAVAVKFVRLDCLS